MRRSLLALGAVLLAALVGTLWRISAPTGAPGIATHSAVESPSTPPSLDAASAPASPAERLEDRPREALPTIETPVPVETESARVPGRIEGHVFRRDGAPAAAGTFVIAREPDNLRLDLDLAERIERGDPTLPSTRSDAEGRFALAGLAPGASYVLTAVGNGALSTQAAPPVAEGTTGVRIDVSLLYGIAVELREAGGAPLRTEHGLREPGPPYTSAATPFPESSLLDLVGLDLAPYRAGPHRRLFLFTCPKAVEPTSLERLPLRFRFAGYAPAEVAFDALPILPAIPQHTVELKSTAQGWGEIVVAFDDARDPTTDGPRVKPFRLLLSSASGPQAEIELPREAGPKRLSGIPLARYRISLLNALDQQIFPKPGGSSTPLDVGATPATFPVSLAWTSELEIQVRGSEGRRYEGRASFSLARGDLTADGRSLVGPTASVMFDHAPYVLGGLLPGHYALFVQEPAAAVVEPASSNGLFDLEPGVAKTVMLSMD